MSGKAFLGWIERDGTRRHSAVLLQPETIAHIVEQMKASNPNATDRLVPAEEIETWMAQS
jgi:hypothetical protein